MLSKLILVAATGSLMRGFFLLRRERLLNTIFKDVEKMQIYNLDYLASLDDLPKNKFILLCGKACKIGGVNYRFKTLISIVRQSQSPNKIPYSSPTQLLSHC